MLVLFNNVQHNIISCFNNFYMFLCCWMMFDSTYSTRVHEFWATFKVHWNWGFVAHRNRSKFDEGAPNQWEFQDPKLEVPAIYKAYVRPM